MARKTELVRLKSGRILAGVAGGLADYLGWPRFLVRLLFVIFAFTGIGELVYIVMWLLVPKTGR